MIIERPITPLLAEPVAPTPETPQQKELKRGKLSWLGWLLALSFGIVAAVFALRAFDARNLPRMLTSETDTALRGRIITSDGVVVAASEKYYTAAVDARNIDPNKKELFVKLYSIYSGESEGKIRAALAKNASVTLSRELDYKRAAFVKDLARKLYRFGVFVAYEDPATKRAFTRGLDVSERGQKRGYIAKDALSPLLGYTQKRDDGYTVQNTGLKGVEGFYNAKLSATTDAKIIGSRDVGGNLIMSKNSLVSERKDGADVVLNVNFALQRDLEGVVAAAAEQLGAREVIVAVMHASSGKMLALASSARFNPARIAQSDLPRLNVAAAEFAFEPGSVMKPFIFASLLQNNQVDAFERVMLGGGALRIGSNTIRDSHPYEQLIAEDIIVVSSNIGMVRLIERTDAAGMLAGLAAFGFGERTGVDIASEARGQLPAYDGLRQSLMDRASLSFGYGMSATFMQILAAYNAINNDGVFVAPRVAGALVTADGRADITAPAREVLRKEVAWEMKRILQKVVESPRGTGRRAQLGGVRLGGKTGTAHINEKGAYVRRYNASFFGFASDNDGHSYTLGVLVREPEPVNYQYYAARSAIPVFKSAVEALVERGLLNVDADALRQEIRHTGSDILD